VGRGGYPSELWEQLQVGVWSRLVAGIWWSWVWRHSQGVGIPACVGLAQGCDLVQPEGQRALQMEQWLCRPMGQGFGRPAVLLLDCGGVKPFTV
jgi:hypothetical protein